MGLIFQALAAFLFACLTLRARASTGNGTDAKRSRGVATCTAIQSALGTDIVVSSGLEYVAGASGAWNLFNAQSSPACIVLPSSALHVQVAMRAIFQNKVRFAVQAGGHSAMQGWNTVQDGILISFTKMQSVTYNPATDTITLQPGVRWVDAIAAVESYGVAPLGGRVSDVGTGLLLGGGLSFLGPEYGFSADMYKELDVVLVTGKLVTVTATNEYADLFRALKGGANRFGIVTRYEVYAVHTGTKDDKNWFGGIITYPESSYEALINATAHYVQTVTDPKAALLVALAYYSNGTSLSTANLAAVFYRGSSLPSSIFSSFLTIPSISQSLGPLSYSSVAATVNADDTPGFGQLFGASALNGPSEVYIEAFRHFKNLSTTIIPSEEVFINSLALTPVPRSQVEAGRRRGGNAIDPPLGSYTAVQLATQFFPGVTEVPDEVEKGRLLFFDQVPRSPGLPLYVNECDKKQNVFETYGGYEFLKQTYMKYDPTRFNVHYTDGPIGL